MRAAHRLRRQRICGRPENPDLSSGGYPLAGVSPRADAVMTRLAAGFNPLLYPTRHICDGKRAYGDFRRARTPALRSPIYLLSITCCGP